jgi:hypothetical protein
MLTDLLVVSAAAAFIISFVERWLDGGLFRGGVALLASVVGLWVLNYDGWRAVIAAMASAFAALIMVLVGERLATPSVRVTGKPR